MPDNSTLSTLLMLAVMGVAFWLLLIRPAQRKQKAQVEMVSKLGPGSRVVTTAGVLATVREVGERTTVIELSPGVEMTVLKQAIMRTVTADEDEFEYDEDDDVEDAIDEGPESRAGLPVPDEAFDPQRPIDPDTRTN